MITWSKYPENKPERIGDYLILIYLSEPYVTFWNGIGFDIKAENITHFTEINTPQSDIVQPSTEGC